MTTNETISARILYLRANGMGIREAIDFVLGEGAYMKLAGEVYDELRARAAAKSPA